MKKIAENPESSYFRVKVMLVCPPGKHGPFCSVSCTPPTIRHWCDPKTGNLKCFGKWSGSDCNDNSEIIYCKILKLTIKQVDAGKY